MVLHLAEMVRHNPIHLLTFANLRFGRQPAIFKLQSNRLKPDNPGWQFNNITIKKSLHDHRI
jgi:hypothetical protein